MVYKVYTYLGLKKFKATVAFVFSKQGSEDGLKEKNEIIARLEEKTSKITAAMRQLEQRYSISNLSFFFAFSVPPFLYSTLTPATKTIRKIQIRTFFLKAQQNFAFFVLIVAWNQVALYQPNSFVFAILQIFQKGLILAILYGLMYYIRQIHKQNLEKVKNEQIP